jgi:hypothetical protein
LVKGELGRLEVGDGLADDFLVLGINQRGVAIAARDVFGAELIVKPQHILRDRAAMVVRGIEDEALASDAMLLQRSASDAGDHFVTEANKVCRDEHSHGGRRSLADGEGFEPDGMLNALGEPCLAPIARERDWLAGRDVGTRCANLPARCCGWGDEAEQTKM